MSSALNATAAASQQPPASRITDINRFLADRMRQVSRAKIEEIGQMIANSVADNLGPEAKLRRAIQDVTKGGAPTLETAPGAMGLYGMRYQGTREIPCETGNAFFPKLTDRAKFVERFAFRLNEELVKTFSQPNLFILGDGRTFKFFEYEPEGILAETAQELGLRIFLHYAPAKYIFRLGIDKTQSQEQQKLVLSLMEASSEHSKQTVVSV